MITINIPHLFAREKWGKRLAEDQAELRERNQRRIEAAKQGARK